MSFRSVFVAVFLGTALIVAAVLVNRARPEGDTAQPSADHVKATGKCAGCHRQETAAVVHEFETSRHAAVGVSCLDCHAAAEGQASVEHAGFEISTKLSAKNCASCHTTQYDQYLRSRHALPAWAAVRGDDGIDPALVEASETHHPGAVKRPHNALSLLEGAAAIRSGCVTCHAIGEPQSDGSVGRCTECHGRHAASVEVARHPQTCGQCHLGPDHSQLEIYRESKHGILFEAQRDRMNLSASPSELTTADMPVPTCSTCHMSGLDDLKVTHDTTERLSWFLFAPVSTKRAGYTRGQLEMKEVCAKCHAKSTTETFYSNAEAVVAATNEKVAAVQQTVAALRADGLLTPEPFDETIEFKLFDYWHYFGRTAKHGAFMGGADFVQWHGNYELLQLGIEIKELAREIRDRAAHAK